MLFRSGCLSDFGHSSPLSPNGFPCLDAVDPANSRMPPVSASPFQDGTVFSAPQYDFLLLSTAHNQTAWSRIVLPAPPEGCNHTPSLRYGICEITSHMCPARAAFDIRQIVITLVSVGLQISTEQIGRASCRERV